MGPALPIIGYSLLAAWLGNDLLKAGGYDIVGKITGKEAAEKATRRAQSAEARALRKALTRTAEGEAGILSRRRRLSKAGRSPEVDALMRTLAMSSGTIPGALGTDAMLAGPDVDSTYNPSPVQTALQVIQNSGMVPAYQAATDDYTSPLLRML